MLLRASVRKRPPEVVHRRLEIALEIARSRHSALREGDVEAYSALEDDLASACSSIETPALSEADIPVLDELIGIETQSRGLLQSLMDETSARMENLQQHSRANSAYAAHELSL